MSVLTQEISELLLPLQRGEAGEYLVGITFPAEFSGFKGHFTGRPVLPGVCLLQTALVALEAQGRGPVKLKRLLAAKWLAPVLPGERLELVLRLKPAEAGLVQVKGVVKKDTARMAEFTLEVAGLEGGALNS